MSDDPIELLIAEPGPVRVDPALAAPAAPDPADEPQLATIPDIAEDSVRAFLQGVVGGGVGLALSRSGVTAPGLGRFADDELDDIAPALTRYANRHRSLRVAGQHADLMVVAAAGLRYTARTVTAYRTAAQETADDHHPLPPR